MKLIKVLDKEGSNLVTDPTNQTILRELVTAEHSTSDLSQKLNLPTLNIWRRIQKLQKAKLIELTTTQKVGNLEKKLYRATATTFAPQQYFNFTPKNPALNQAFEIYNGIQRKMMTQTTVYGDVPKDADPIDYAFFVNMMVFADICSRPDIQTKIVELKEKLSKFNPPKVV
ncbi:MAG TPA: winged helix-turn-helix domain-containing protein [Candidatus Acidoferrales bacterium]|nr:winged helix-turn-helix domain-containing protein [Candidatus Acidoferrales bacterium]